MLHTPSHTYINKHTPGSLAISIVEQLARSMGPGVKQHFKTILPGLFINFGDKKVSKWCEGVVVYEGNMHQSIHISIKK